MPEDVGKVEEGTSGSGASTIPWYETTGLPKEDHDIYAKYKTPDDAIKSIASRERLLGKNIQIPSADLKPEDQENAHREILAKLGAPKGASGYAISEWIKTIPKEILDTTPPGYFDVLAADAKALGLLPWQVKRFLAIQTQRVMEMRQREADAAPDREKEEVQRWSGIVGPKIELAKAEAEGAAKRLDHALFAAQNSKLDPEVFKNNGGVLVQALREANDPILYKVMQHINDRLFSESPQPNGQRTGAEPSEYQRQYDFCKATNPNRGEEYWHKYAKEMTGGGR